jgi:hypothetical protein
MRASGSMPWVLPLAVVFAAGALAKPPSVLQYPPDQTFTLGTATAAPYQSADMEFSCAFGVAPYTAAKKSASRLMGTGEGLAFVSFGYPIGYVDENKSGTYAAWIGNTAALNYSSTAGGTIVFDFAVTALTYKGAEPLGKSFPFAVKSSSVNDDGSFTLEFTIQFPNCPLTIQASYR